MTALRAIGLMSGTSMDGIDVAALETDGVAVSATGPSISVPYEARFRRRIEAALETAKSIVKREERPGDLAELEREITLRHADAVRKFLADAEPDWRRPDVIGFHGQTVLHRPAHALTVQLGDGALLARETGIAVVHDMRANDMKHGGQGAPLVPAYHAALARSLPNEFAGDFPVVFVNIGGISNITYVAREGDPIAFDTGPGNTLIDQWVAREGGVPFDAGGAIAREGGVNRAVVERYLDNKFFEKSGPKSLDRNDFTLELARGPRTLRRRAYIGSRVSRGNSEVGRPSARTAEALDRVRRRTQESSHRRRSQCRRREGRSESDRRRRGGAQWRRHRGGSLGVSCREVGEGIAADVSDDDRMPCRRDWRGPE